MLRKLAIACLGLIVLLIAALAAAILITWYVVRPPGMAQLPAIQVIDSGPIKDEVYLQEVGRQIKTDFPLSAVAVHDGTVYVGAGNGVMRLTAGDTLAAVAGGPSSRIIRMVSTAQGLWVIAEDGLWRLEAATWDHVSGEAFVDICEHQSNTILATSRALFGATDDAPKPLANAAQAPADILAIASYAETLYGLTSNGLIMFDGRSFTTDHLVDFGKLPRQGLRSLLACGSRLLIATSQGLGMLRGASATLIQGKHGLPYEDTTALAQGFGDDFWIATPHGAIRAVTGDYHVFSAKRWLPGNHVNAIACAERTAYIATDAGLGIIDYEPYTLLKKAAYYERHLEEWGQKRGAFTHKLERNEEKGGWVREVSDNDVGWSTHYWAAQAFKYAATKDEQARQNAIAGFNTMKWSEEITPIEGYPARAIWGKGETCNRATGGSGGYPAEWNPTDDGQFAWKGDTSSDEICAQFYYAAIFYELVADEQQKALVREHLSRIANHIVENNFRLIDLDGKPTRWGRWDSAYFNETWEGYMARGLNGLEIVSFIRTAQAITGDSAFQEAYDRLLDMGCHTWVINQKHWWPPFAVFDSDDRLAFYSYYTLLQYETDPYLRGAYRRSLEKSWEIERIEHIPWFNFIYGALTGNDCEAGVAVQFLREYPLDLIRYSYDHSARADLYTAPGYISYTRVGERFLSPRERGGVRWTDTSVEAASGGGGHSVSDPASWLDAYWMGRYYGYILPPDTADPELTTVPQRGLSLGSVPYDGPPMPNVLEK